MLKTRIKASQISNLTDARYFAAWQVEWLSFSLDAASENRLNPTQIQALKAWVEGPKMVGEFGLQNPEEIATAVQMLNLDVVQVSPFAPVKEIHKKVDIPIIKSIIPESVDALPMLYDQLKQEAHFVEAFLLHLDKISISWSMVKAGDGIALLTLKEWCRDFSIILSLDFQAEEVVEIIEELQPYGLNLVGGEEEKVGLKSFDDLDAVFELLEDLE